MENNTSFQQGSFRDPAGHIFVNNKSVFRSIHHNYQTNYDYLIKSGLFEHLTKNNLLVSHEELSVHNDGAYKTIKPKVIPFISYPFEWTFSQLKDAALLTLEIQEIALSYGMTLKDASAYNVQFIGSKPIFIDTLSFEIYNPSKPWVAYRQFCQHFLAPLALSSHVDIRINHLLRQFLDGIPLDFASKLLPTKTKLNFSLLTHLHLHAKSSAYYADKKVALGNKVFSKHSMLALIDSLKNAIKSLTFKMPKTQWGDYYDNTNYSKEAFENKLTIIKGYLEKIKPQEVWDMGANSGIFSNLAAMQNAYTLSFDFDHVAVEKNYLESKEKNSKNILPLVLDITNPTPSLGWHHQERNSLLKRGPAEMVFALGLVHHLVITNNIPLHLIAYFLKDIGKYLVVEFIQKDDSQVQRLMFNKQDNNHQYCEDSFEYAFANYFTIVDKSHIEQSKRVLYLMEKI